MAPFDRGTRARGDDVHKEWTWTMLNEKVVVPAAPAGVIRLDFSRCGQPSRPGFAPIREQVKKVVPRQVAVGREATELSYLGGAFGEMR